MDYCLSFNIHNCKINIFNLWLFTSFLPQGQPPERFRRSASLSGEMVAGQKPQAAALSHRPTGPISGQEGMSFGFQQGRMMHPGMARMPGPNPYETVMRGQTVPRMASLPQQMMHPWPPQHPRNLPLGSSYGMMQPGNMMSMRSVYSADPSGGPPPGHLQHPQMSQGLAGSSMLPPQSFGAPLQVPPDPSVMPQTQTILPLGPTHGHHDSDKSSDQFEDILGRIP